MSDSAPRPTVTRDASDPGASASVAERAATGDAATGERRRASRGLLVRVIASAVVGGLALVAVVVWTLARLPAVEPEPAGGSASASEAGAGGDGGRVETLAALPAQVLPPGTPAEELALATLDGGTVDLADLRGQPVVVNFWAPDCVPCEAEFPLLADAYERHSAAGLEIVGVTVRGSAADVRAFVDDHDAGWTIAMDGDQKAAGRWQVAGIPQTFFVRPDGTVASRQLGEIDAASFRQQLAEIGVP